MRKKVGVRKNFVISIKRWITYMHKELHYAYYAYKKFIFTFVK